MSDSDTQRDFDDFFSEVEATRKNYFWKYYDDQGRPTLTHNPDRVEYRREVFGLDCTIISYDER